MQQSIRRPYLALVPTVGSLAVMAYGASRSRLDLFGVCFVATLTFILVYESNRRRGVPFPLRVASLFAVAFALAHIAGYLLWHGWPYAGAPLAVVALLLMTQARNCM